MRRAVPSMLALALLACLQVETFFFAGEPIEGYRWDEASPELDGSLTEPHASLVPATHRTEGLATLADGRAIHWVFARRDGATTTILYSHGNGPHLGRAWDRVELLWELGHHVLVYDYPGYGRSPGPSSEQGLYDAIDAVWDQVLPALPDVDPSAVTLYGHSLGGGPTLHLAARLDGEPGRPRSVITESIWCSIEAQIQDGAFLDLPRELLAHLSIDNCARIGELSRTPVHLLHGDQDRVVPLRQLRLLEQEAGSPITVHVVAGAGHTDVPTVAGASYVEWIRGATL